MKDYTDFEMTGLPDSPVVRKAHDLLLRTLERQYNSEGRILDTIYDQNPGIDNDIAESAAVYHNTLMPELAQVYLERAVETARIVYANSAFDSDDLVAAALLLDCVEDNQAIDDVITEIDETAGIPVLELDQIAQDTDNPLEALEHLSDAAKLLVLANAIQGMSEMNKEFDRIAKAGKSGAANDDGQWRMSIDNAGVMAEELYEFGREIKGIDAGLDNAFAVAQKELAGHVLDSNRNFFADARNRIKNAASALKK